MSFPTPLSDANTGTGQLELTERSLDRQRNAIVADSRSSIVPRQSRGLATIEPSGTSHHLATAFRYERARVALTS